MANHPDSTSDRADPGATAPRRLTTTRGLLLLYSIAVYGCWAILPFVAAATVRWPEGWVYFGVLLLGQAGHRAYVSRHAGELLKRRQQLGAGTLRWDFWWNLLFWPLMAAVAIVAGLDASHLWWPLPWWPWPAGLLLFAAGIVVSAWAMSCNRHFEGTVRIQHDVGHVVVDRGPYRVIRHPGYLGLILWALASPLLLLSGAALIPALAVVGWLALRTGLEDRFLQRELAGYADYARRTRFRLVPGVW